MSFLFNEVGLNQDSQEKKNQQMKQQKDYSCFYAFFSLECCSCV